MFKALSLLHDPNTILSVGASHHHVEDLEWVLVCLTRLLYRCIPCLALILLVICLARSQIPLLSRFRVFVFTIGEQCEGQGRQCRCFKNSSCYKVVVATRQFRRYLLGSKRKAITAPTRPAPTRLAGVRAPRGRRSTKTALRPSKNLLPPVRDPYSIQNPRQSIVLEYSCAVFDTFNSFDPLLYNT